jgi:hypothetical protein
MFLGPQKPIATCESPSCDGCTLTDRIHCHFRLKDLIHFLLIALPPFLLGGAGIVYVSGWWIIPWLLFVIAFFGFIEIRVMCSHCPHYAEPGNSLRCWANYGSPKLWTYRPGPMSIIEKVVFFSGFVVVWGYPLLFLILSGRLFFLLIYLIATAGFFMTLKTYLCSQCMNFACPLNSVIDENRQQFFEKNPSVAEAWPKIEN